MKLNGWKEEGHITRGSMVSGGRVQGGIAHSAKSTKIASFDTMVTEHDLGMFLQASVPRIPNQERQDAGSDKLKPTWQLLITTFLP